MSIKKLNLFCVGNEKKSNLSPTPCLYSPTHPKSQNNSHLGDRRILIESISASAFALCFSLMLRFILAHDYQELICKDARLVEYPASTVSHISRLKSIHKSRNLLSLVVKLFEPGSKFSTVRIMTIQTLKLRALQQNFLRHFPFATLDGVANKEEKRKNFPRRQEMNMKRLWQ